MDHPEPIEPVLASVPGGLYCLVHGEMDCDLPFCWRCGNHEMDDFERCADPRCRASNDETARAIVEHLKSHDEWRWRPVPLELIEVAIGCAYLRDSSVPSFRPGEPGGGGESEPPSTAGAGSTWDGADDRD